MQPTPMIIYRRNLWPIKLLLWSSMMTSAFMTWQMIFVSESERFFRKSDPQNNFILGLFWKSLTSALPVRDAIPLRTYFACEAWNMISYCRYRACPEQTPSGDTQDSLRRDASHTFAVATVWINLSQRQEKGIPLHSGEFKFLLVWNV